MNKFAKYNFAVKLCLFLFLIYGFLSPSSVLATSSYYFFHQDHQGSIQVVTDSAGKVVSGKTFYPYGTIRNQIGTSPTEMDYTGQIRDTGSGLMYYNARYYDPKLSLFTQPDPVGGITKYTYANSNPVRFSDSTGNRVDDDASGGSSSPPEDQPKSSANPETADPETPEDLGPPDYEKMILEKYGIHIRAGASYSKMFYKFTTSELERIYKALGIIQQKTPKLLQVARGLTFQRDDKSTVVGSSNNDIALAQYFPSGRAPAYLSFFDLIFNTNMSDQEFGSYLGHELYHNYQSQSLPMPMGRKAMENITFGLDTQLDKDLYAWGQVTQPQLAYFSQMKGPAIAGAISKVPEERTAYLYQDFFFGNNQNFSNIFPSAIINRLNTLRR